jgi:protein SCO1/2
MRRLASLVMVLLLCGAGIPRPVQAHSEVSDLAWRPHPGAALPMTARLLDEHGRRVSLARFFHGAPVVLLLDYLHCKSLCGVALENLIAALGALPVDAGRDFRLLVVSIDPRDTPVEAAAAKDRYLAPYRHSGGEKSVHFLTGSQQAVREIANAIGFPYRYDAETDEYVHPAGFVVATPDGHVSRYFLGVAVTAAQLRTGLADAVRGKALGPLTRILLLCHIAGAPLGRYTVPVLAAFTVADIAATAGLVAVFLAIRRRRHG